MKPVDQDRFGEGEGNCLSACLASLLELRLADVPLFIGEGWLARMNEWLRPRGLWALLFAPPADPQTWLVPGFAIVSGPTSRGLLHATVWCGGRLEHDPHPSREGLLSVEDVIVLVPLDPVARLDGAAADSREPPRRSPPVTVTGPTGDDPAEHGASGLYLAEVEAAAAEGMPVAVAALEGLDDWCFATPSPARDCHG